MMNSETKVSLAWGVGIIVLALGLSAAGVPLVEQVLLSAAMCVISAWLGYRLYAAEKLAALPAE